MLSATSGAVDAFVFLCVGHVFAGVMTGNLVLLGASAAGAGEDGVAWRATTALVAYGGGAALGAWLAEARRLPAPVTLLIEAVLLAGAAALWGPGLIVSDGDRLGLLSITALAMGIQGRVRVTPTNYFTGTLTALIARAALRAPRPGDGWAIGRVVGVVAGAGATALTVRFWPGAAAAVGAVLAVCALLLETAPGGRRGRKP
ncbi:DUF1275 family protein [Streptomyces sp. AM 4-1-1]|uniref:YoaK family protein n=1 Tax=Streptomyces sp. AM 4-1-1 TaxID=3028710 RepID=UPI0023B9E967|nr:DUF1275 family protein [Streptomyces sp. AM 4-1-1]WEH37345.1 DUF1275 family protein [Streptomyces sp. AM 4-1-1]